MEIVKVTMSMDEYKKIHNQGIIHNRIAVDVDDFDYSNDEVWKQLKAESSKAYRKLKEREFYLRHL